ncbi:hypothetical protein Drorol1_Dr00004521 [Drosera rotundifolia]
MKCDDRKSKTSFLSICKSSLVEQLLKFQELLPQAASLPGKMENHNEDAAIERKIIYKGAKIAPLIIGNEAFGVLGNVGSTSNLLVYFTTVFNMNSITATNLVNILNGSSSLAALPGAIISDTYSGRYNAVAVGSISSFLGLLVLALTALPQMHPPQCVAGSTSICQGPSRGQFQFLIVGIVLTVIGAGGIKPCNLAFGVDQFDPEAESSIQGINSFFNWYYMSVALGMLISVTVFVYVQTSLSWALGLGIPAALMFIACICFLVGTKYYVRVKPEGSAYTSLLQVIVVAIKKRHLKLPQKPGLNLFNYVPSKSTTSKLPYTAQFRFLDKAAVMSEDDEINSDGTAANPWELCSMQKVEELKSLVRLIPMWFAGILYFVFISMMENYAVFQALQLNRHLGRTNFQIPAASFIGIALLTTSLWLVIYDKIIVPVLRKFTGKEGGITNIERITIGIAIAILAMVVSAMVEKHRRNVAIKLGLLISPLSWVWLVPQLVIAGVSFPFGVVGLYELYYKEVPDGMKSIGGSFYYCGSAISSYLSTFILSMVQKETTRSSIGDWLPNDLNKGRLDYFYYLMAGLQVVNLVYFVACAKWYNSKGFRGVIPDTDHEVNKLKGLEV